MIYRAVVDSKSKTGINEASKSNVAEMLISLTTLLLWSTLGILKASYGQFVKQTKTLSTKQVFKFASVDSFPLRRKGYFRS